VALAAQAVPVEATQVIWRMDDFDQLDPISRRLAIGSLDGA